MATRANIAIKNQDGTYDRIYTHWDGDSHLPTLKKHYNSEEKARELIELGDLSVLAERVKPSEDEQHTYDNSAPGVTVAYHRDRGEELNVARGLTKDECYQNSYLYIWNGKKWKRR